MHFNKYELNYVHPNQLFSVFQIHSDFDDGTGNIVYSLEGVGANSPPYHVFVVHPTTGLIRVTKVLDRELISTYDVSVT